MENSDMNPASHAQGEPIVRIDKLNKHFGSLHVLKNIDLEVAQGEVVVVIGASGSGKSTLIRCVNGLEEFQQGALRVDGNDLKPDGKASQALQTIRTEVGMVFQQFNLFPHLSVRDNSGLSISLYKVPTDRFTGCPQNDVSIRDSISTPRGWASRCADSMA